MGSNSNVMGELLILIHRYLKAGVQSNFGIRFPPVHSFWSDYRFRKPDYMQDAKLWPINWLMIINVYL